MEQRYAKIVRERFDQLEAQVDASSNPQEVVKSYRDKANGAFQACHPNVTMTRGKQKKYMHDAKTTDQVMSAYTQGEQAQMDADLTQIIVDNRDKNARTAAFNNYLADLFNN